jgi:hypothetical protein
LEVNAVHQYECLLMIYYENKSPNTVESNMRILLKFYKIIDLERDAIKSHMCCCRVATV